MMGKNNNLTQRMNACVRPTMTTDDGLISYLP